MPELVGKFQYLDSAGTATLEGDFRGQFDDQTFSLTPTSAAPLSFDLGDITSLVAADFEIRLRLYTGRTLVLRHLGKAYETLLQRLLQAYRDRAVQCLLLEDLKQIARFPATFELTSPQRPARFGAAEIWLYETNFAVLAPASQSFQWRVSDVDSVRFDSTRYEFTIQSDGETLKVNRLGNRTEEFGSKLQNAIDTVATKSSKALRELLPFLDPDQLQAATALLRESHVAPISKLAAVHPGIPTALTANAVDDDLRPYYEHLASRAAAESVYIGFKSAKAEGESSAAAEEDADEDAASKETMYWFLFPITSSKIVAWETSSRSGRATYFFRLASKPLDSDLRRLNRSLANLNFRRRPIYLSDQDLFMDARYRRYAIAVRQIPELRELRERFVGRAIHNSFDAWQAQVAKTCGSS